MFDLFAEGLSCLMLKQETISLNPRQTSLIYQLSQQTRADSPESLPLPNWNCPFFCVLGYQFKVITSDSEIQICFHCSQICKRGKCQCCLLYQVVFCCSTVSCSSAQWKRSSRYSLQRLGGEYTLTLCSLQRAEAVHYKAAQVWSQPQY